MQRINLEVHPREAQQAEQNRNLNQMRRAGWIPAVLYGHGNPVKVAVNSKAFGKATNTDAGLNALFNIQFGEKLELSMIKDVQRDIFTQAPIHVDFYRINLKEKIDAHIPIHAIGTAAGVKDGGGVLEHVQRDIDIRCLPDLIPGHIDVDVSALEIHDSIKVADLKLAEGIEVMTAGDHIIVNVIPPKVEEEPLPVEGDAAAAAEPEVISKGKKDEEEGGEAKPGAAKPGAAKPAAAKAAKK